MMMLGIGVLGVLMLPPDADGLRYVMTETMSLVAYLQDPGGDIRWAGCATLPEALPPCFHSENGQCVEPSRTFSCGDGGRVQVTLSGTHPLGWRMDVQTTRRGRLSTTPPTDSPPYVLHINLKDPRDSVTWELQVHRTSREGEAMVQGTVVREYLSAITRFQDFRVRLLPGDTLALEVEGTLRVSTRNPSCAEGTYLVKTLRPLRLHPEDLSVLEGALVINGRAFVYTEGRLQEEVTSSCPYRPWHHHSP